MSETTIKQTVRIVYTVRAEKIVEIDLSEDLLEESLLAENNELFDDEYGFDEIIAQNKETILPLLNDFSKISLQKDSAKPFLIEVVNKNPDTII